MAEYLKIASIKEAKGSESATQMVETLISDFTTVITELKQGMEIAQGAGDETTADMLLAIHTTLEKHVWMLTAFNA
jgi:starvation-inducible DNA-binding protein